MRFTEETVYEVWEQRGGFNPTRCLTFPSKDEAERQAAELTEGRRRTNRPEAAVYHYMVVAATTTRREVH